MKCVFFTCRATIYRIAKTLLHVAVIFHFEKGVLCCIIALLII